MLDVLREEKKYRISLLSASILIRDMKNVLHGDSFNGIKSYMVRSLYFDSIFDGDYYEKEAGQHYHKKIRLRIYNTESNTAKLEIKEKQGNLQRKRSLTVSKEDALKMIERKYEVLLNYKEKLAEELYLILTTKMYLPKCIVEYERIAFGVSENNIRLTIDSNVQANEGDFNLFSNDIQLYPVMDLGEVILEVKYNNFLLTYIKDMLRIIDKSEMPASKYCMGRALGLGGI